MRGQPDDDVPGGSLTIYTRCAECNHWLGSNVDSYLTDHWLIQVRRRELGLSGKKGQLPRPRLVGRVDERLMFTTTDAPLSSSLSSWRIVGWATRISRIR